MEKRDASELSKYVAQALRRHRADHGWTAAHASRRSGIAYNTLNRKLKGESEIHIDELFLVCEAIGTDAHSILEAAERLMPAGYLAGRLVSEPLPNVTSIHDTDWDTYEGKKAADNDAEAETDEADQP